MAGDDDDDDDNDDEGCVYHVDYVTLYIIIYKKTASNSFNVV